MANFTTTMHLEPYDRLSASHLRSEYAGKKVIITGGGTGIGASVARSFAEAHVASILLAGRSEGTLEATVAELTQAYPEVKTSYKILDIVSRDSVKAFFESLTEPADILLNNAGYLPDLEDAAEARIDDWWRGFEVNVLGTMLTTQEFLHHRTASSNEPRDAAVIITVNTFGAINMRAPKFTSYAASKIAIMRVLELMPSEIPESVARFVSVNPGAVNTSMSQKSGLLGIVPETHPLLAAEFVVWLASNEAAFLNGRFVSVNWDVDELVAKKDMILSDDLLITSLKGC
jgi:NAD(P)-dependent dehydrogenase (short-subunit alcohol dehydrogenase family)